MNGSVRKIQLVVAALALALLLSGMVANRAEAAGNTGTGWGASVAQCIAYGGTPGLFSVGETVYTTCSYPNGDMVACSYTPDGGGFCWIVPKTGPDAGTGTGPAPVTDLGGTTVNPGTGGAPRATTTHGTTTGGTIQTAAPTPTPVR